MNCGLCGEVIYERYEYGSGQVFHMDPGWALIHHSDGKRLLYWIHKACGEAWRMPIHRNYHDAMANPIVFAGCSPS